jgi:hypothetical protein
MVLLTKSEAQLICECQCESAIAVPPQQLGCPWCGCGWLFVCAHCRKAFTFAEAVETEADLWEVARSCLRQMSSVVPGRDDIDEYAASLEEFYRGVEVGKTYVYLDGHAFATDAPGLEFCGLHSCHELAFVPQMEALHDRSIVSELLRNPAYWSNTSHGL